MEPTKARSQYRDAIRLLFVLVAGAQEVATDGDENAPRAIFRGEARLHALDFWMRNPDYLAEELLDRFEATGDPAWLRRAEHIFDQGEPDLRRIPMLRYRFGAYERLDNAFNVLCSRRLVRIVAQTSAGKVVETDFLLYGSAFALAQSIAAEFPLLRWFADRAALVLQVAGARGGAALKARQYEQAEYAETCSGGVIPPIAERVSARLSRLRTTHDR